MVTGGEKLIKKTRITLTILILLVMVQSTMLAKADDTKPIIVCTTSAVGSIVQEYLGDSADIVVLVQPSLCPADFDMKPSDIYAVSKAKILFKQNIQGEFWLQGLLEAAGNTNLIQVAIPGEYNTPEGAGQYIKWVGGNLTKILDIDLDAKKSAMLADIDEVSNWIASQAQTLQASTVKVICMSWLKSFIESVGFKVVATYNPPETLSVGDIINLVDKAKSEGVALIADNLQIDVEFGKGIASQVGAEHLILTNFPGAIPGTGNLTQMFRYNAEKLFNATSTWRFTSALKVEMEGLNSQVTTYQITTSLAVIAAAVEAMWLYMGRRRK